MQKDEVEGDQNQSIETKGSSPEKTFLTVPKTEGFTPYTLHDLLFPAGKVAKLV